MSSSFGYSTPQHLQLITKVIPISSTASLGGTSYNNTHLITGTGNFTVTLPLLSLGRASYTLHFSNDTAAGTTTLAAQGSDYIRVNGTNVTTVSLGPGESITFSHTGSSWSLLDTAILKSNLHSPTFTGTPRAPTAAQNTNSTQLATTAFVLAQAGVVTPSQLGTAQAGSANTFSRADHIHASVAPTPATTDNSTAIATTAFVKSAVPTEAIAKAWVNFNGTLTGTITPRNSFGVSSITKNGTGDYSVSWSTAQPNADYTVFTSVGGDGASAYFTSNTSIAAPTTLGIRFRSGTYNGAGVDAVRTSVVMFGS